MPPSVFETPVPNVVGMSMAGMSPTPSIGNPQAQGFFSGSGFNDFASGLRGVTRNFAAGFAKDPQVRQQAGNALMVDEQQKQAEKRDMIAQSFERMKQLATAIQGTGSVPPALGKMVDKEASILAQVSGDPQYAQQMRDYAFALASVPREQEAFTLGPQQQRYVGGQLVAENPTDPDLLSPEALEQKKALAEAGRSQTSMQVKLPEMESAFQSELGKTRGKDAALLGTASQRALGTVQQVQAAEALISNMQAAGTDPGKLAGLAANVAGYMQSVGLDPSDLGLPADAGPTQAVDAILNKLALEFIGAESGGLPANTFSEADRKFITQIAGTTADTPEGLRLKMETIRRSAEQLVKQNNMWLQYPQTEKGFEQFVQDWSNTSLSKNVFEDLDKSTLKKKAVENADDLLTKPPEQWTDEDRARAKSLLGQ